MRFENPENTFEERNNFLVDVGEEIFGILEEKKLTRSEVGTVFAVIDHMIDQCIVRR